jgi:hypothetical protein
MPLNNIGKNHLTAAQKTAIDNALKVILTELATVTPNFSDEERKKYGSVNEQNKLIVNKVNDFHTSQPALQSPDVDWAEFELDFDDRSFADSKLSIVASITKQLSDFKIAHDYDNYQDALTDYSYAQYKAGTNTPGFSEKVNELKQFFSRTGTETNSSTEKKG